jgi:hypothetical protein
LQPVHSLWPCWRWMQLVPLKLCTISAYDITWCYNPENHVLKNDETCLKHLRGCIIIYRHKCLIDFMKFGVIFWNLWSM